MTHKPPVPDDNQSPYPIEEAPHDGSRTEGETLKALKEAQAAKQREKSISPTAIGFGAAVGIGSAALLGALLYARSKGKNDDA